MKKVLLVVCLGACALVGLGLVSAAYAGSTVESPSVPTFQHSNVSTFLGATPTCVAQYMCSVTAGATIVPGTDDTGNHTDDGVTNVNLPFSFSLYGASYASVNVSSNGNAQFVSANTEFANVCLPFDGMGPTI